MRSYFLLITVAILVAPALDGCKKSGADAGSTADASPKASHDPSTDFATQAATPAPTESAKNFSTAAAIKAPPQNPAPPAFTVVQPDKHGLPAAAVSKLAGSHPIPSAERAAEAQK
jgi:hypothetical protein